MYGRRAKFQGTRYSKLYFCMYQHIMDEVSSFIFCYIFLLCFIFILGFGDINMSWKEEIYMKI